MVLQQPEGDVVDPRRDNPPVVKVGSGKTMQRPPPPAPRLTTHDADAAGVASGGPCRSAGGSIRISPLKSLKV